ncbi:conserved hypothetical protein [Betalipothrixvirus acidiani]|uniref:Uncharacterized protein n=1 Tax=Betalipothrixvirus acidiani TaxID=346881 RepID=A7WK89_9VIRU|nr:hypothetical protein AFV3_gp67 [Acidianus filamentous virus 3]CAL69589.1 conserved hypothetical protein [Acidianus filamentous virus 3]
MLPNEVVVDVMNKMPFMKKVYASFYYYYSIEDVIPDDVLYAIDSVFHNILIQDFTLKPKFDGYKFREIYDIISQWNSTSLDNALIYRGTSLDYVENLDRDFYTSGGFFRVIHGDSKFLTFWSYFPASALIFASQASRPVLLVAKYDPKYCAPDNYFSILDEFTGIIDDKPYNHGAIKYLREMEVRCYKFPVANTKYMLKGKDLLDLFNMVVPVYRQYMDEEEVERIRKGLEVK